MYKREDKDTTCKKCEVLDIKQIYLMKIYFMINDTNLVL
jgi:hypothetical protein